MSIVKEIKRLDVAELAEKFGLEQESEYFVFKPQEYSHKRSYEPHRSEMYDLGLIVAGQAVLKTGLETYLVKAPGLIAIGADHIRQWSAPDENIKTISLFFAEDFVVSGLLDTTFIKKFSFYKRTGSHFISLTDNEFISIKGLFDQIEKKKNSEAPNRIESIRALIRALLFEVESFHETQVNNNIDKHSRGNHLAEQFKEILAIDFIEHRSVTYYADKLFVTPKHLSQILKVQTGRTISELIDEIVCLEARVLMQNKELNISGISEYLNFANPSFFGKFFKRNTGMSPMQYRKLHLK